jgi:pimeloyl-ACP methyl ester carboxylesterase
MHVELISVKTSDGVSLEGALRVPDGKAARNGLPVDIVILHHGVGGSFYRPSFHDAIGDELLARGCAVLRVNNRGHDLAYNAPPPHKRLGAAFETVADCRLDWKAWNDFAASRGYSKIGVWGHSLGAVKTIYTLANDHDPRVARAVASSPPRFSYSSFLARPDGDQFAAAVKDAQALVNAGKTDVIFPIEIPTSAIMTPRTYFDKYGAEERYDILKHLPNIKTPLLITIGGLEGREGQADRYAFGGLSDKVAKAVAGSNTKAFELIEGADHFYTGVTDKLWRAVERWLTT